MASTLAQIDPLLTVDDVAVRLNVTKDWVWDHSSRKAPYLPVIRIGDGTLRYRLSQIEEFVNERERLSILRRKRRYNEDAHCFPPQKSRNQWVDRTKQGGSSYAGNAGMGISAKSDSILQQRSLGRSLYVFALN